MELINQNKKFITELCNKFKVSKMYVFGSILTNRFNEGSDVDLSFRFNQEVDYHVYSDLYFGLQHALETLFSRKVDLVDEEVLKNKYFIRELNQTKQLIYG